MTLGQVEYKPSPWSRVAPPGTPGGNARLRDFIAELCDILGDVRFLLIHATTDTTTSTDRSRNARVITHDATIAGAIFSLGSGTYRTYNGTSHESDMPDADSLSFGNAAVDEPFTIIALVNPDDGTPAADMEIVAKWNRDTDGELREYRAYVDATNGYPTLELYDESANAYIGREDQTALTDATWVLLGFHYDGSAANTGIRVTKNAARLDDANVTSGTYVAMENSATKTAIAHSLSAAATPVATNFWDGGIAFVLMVAKDVSLDEIWAVKEAVNAYHGLTL